MEVMEQRLLYAITHCSTIDGDGGGYMSDVDLSLNDNPHGIDSDDSDE